MKNLNTMVSIMSDANGYAWTTGYLKAVVWQCLTRMSAEEAEYMLKSIDKHVNDILERELSNV